MYDIKLDSDGDIEISALGDIVICESVRQQILIRLRWILKEWRLGPELGFPWFDEVFVKNPNIEKIKILIRNEIMAVEGVEEAEVKDVTYQPYERTAKFVYTITVNSVTYNEEVLLNE